MERHFLTPSWGTLTVIVWHNQRAPLVRLQRSRLYHSFRYMAEKPASNAARCSMHGVKAATSTLRARARRSSCALSRGKLCREAQLAFGLQCASSAVPLFSDARADNCRDLGVGGVDCVSSRLMLPIPSVTRRPHPPCRPKPGANCPNSWRAPPLPPPQKDRGQSAQPS